MLSAPKSVGPMGPREMLEGLVEYARKYADQNQEPEGGDCRGAILKLEQLLKWGVPVGDVRSLVRSLAGYVERLADSNGEQVDGNCRRTVAAALEYSSEERGRGVVATTVPARVTDAMHLAAMAYLSEQGVAVASQMVNGALNAAMSKAEVVEVADLERMVDYGLTAHEMLELCRRRLKAEG